MKIIMMKIEVINNKENLEGTQMINHNQQVRQDQGRY